MTFKGRKIAPLLKHKHKQEIEEEEEVIGPQPGPQEFYLRSIADVCIYGGAAGGGKSWSLLFDPIRYLHVPGFTSVIFRRTYKQVKNEGGLWDTSSKIYPDLGGIPKESDLYWSFPEYKNKITFAHLEHEKHKFNYQGSELCYIAFDELTHFTESQFFYLMSRNRSTCGIKPYIRAATNPDADSWVAELISYWIDPDTGYPILSRSGQLRYFVRYNDRLIFANSIQELREETRGQIPDKDFMPKSLTFVPANLEDNPILTSSDPAYRGNLLILSLVDRERLLGGNWLIKFSSGNMFKTPWFPVIDLEELPVNYKLMNLVRSWDTAATEPNENNKDPDYSAGVLMGEYKGRYYILDLQYFRKNPAGTEEMFSNTAKMDGRDINIIMEQEPGSAAKREIDRLKTTLFKGYNFRGIPAGKQDKISRAKFLSAAAENGLIIIVRGQWNAAFLNDLIHFPDPKFHDDITDAAAAAYNYLSGRLLSGDFSLSKVVKSGSVTSRKKLDEMIKAMS